MPELPEVETVVRELRRKLKGRRIKSIKINFSGVIRPRQPRAFAKALTGQIIADVSRRGKLIIFRFGQNSYLLVHLKMTGQLIFNQPSQTKHTHVVLTLDNGEELHYNDIRKFGFLEIVTKKELTEVLEKRFSFGPEPLLPEFNWEYFYRKLHNKGVAIKKALLDQSVVAGIGNIYADEALFRAGIDPRKRARRLSEAEVKRLYNAIKEVLREAIKAGGSSSNNYVRTSGKKGSFQDSHNVYRKTGEPCPNCDSPIKRVVLGGRSTHYCPKCQK